HVIPGAARRPLESLAVEPLPQLLAGLEEGNPLLLDMHGFSGPRVAPDALRPVLDRKGAESAQLDAVSLRQRRGDFLEDRIHDVLDIAQKEMRIPVCNGLDQLGLDHGNFPRKNCRSYL